MHGYIIERQGVSWDERFYKSYDSNNEPVFGSDKGATIFVSREDAESTRMKIINESHIYVTVHARSEFYPPGF